MSRLLTHYRAWRVRRAFDKAMRLHSVMILRMLGERN